MGEHKQEPYPGAWERARVPTRTFPESELATALEGQLLIAKRVIPDVAQEDGDELEKALHGLMLVSQYVLMSIERGEVSDKAFAAALDFTENFVDATKPKAGSEG